LYGHLLGESDAPADVVAAAGRFRYGRGEMQIHMALDELPRWKGPRADELARTPIVHVTPGLDGVSRAVNEAERGLLPAEATIVRAVLSPADIERANVNLVGGDIYGGSCALDQNLLWRPFAEAPGHRTAVDGLWHIGASTHPGPGLGAGSGYLVYKALTQPPL